MFLPSFVRDMLRFPKGGIDTTFVVSSEVVSTLTSSDAKRLLQFVGRAEELAGNEPFSPETLAELGRLVEADWIGYREVDLLRRRVVLDVERSVDDEPVVELEDGLLWRFLEEDPVFRRHRSGYVGALKLSDFVSRRQLHRMPMYDQWFRPSGGVQYVLALALPSPPWHTRTFLLDRFDRDFSERDRLMLDQLQPHLDRIWHNAHVRRRLTAALAGLEHASRSNPHGVVLLSAGNRIEFASPPARRLLAEFFPEPTGRGLPRLLADWLQAGAGRPFLSRRGERCLKLERVGEALMLEEQPEPLPLTARERDVLAWVARGKRNAEVAQLLSISPGTVRKHLENAYPKLGVQTRTAAAARFLGLIESQDDLALERGLATQR